MKVLIGVCGIGLGHSTRQLEIAKELANRNHEVRILTFGKGINFFENTGFPFYSVWVPFIDFKGRKLDLKSIITHNTTKFISGYIKNKKVFSQLIKDGFIPDMCISDYEPVTARFAYKLNKPLVLVDQQSKFWRYSFEDISGYSSIEEKKRLSFFFPKVHKSFITSFYRLPSIENENIEVIPSIIREDIRKISLDKQYCDKKHVVVYFSEYVNGRGIKQTKCEWMKELFSLHERAYFTVFSRETKEYVKRFNIDIKPFDRKQFAESLKSADAVITTAGHTLLSEALYLGLPIYVIPLETFDQHYCAKFIKENYLGYSSYMITKGELVQFLNLNEQYKRNIKNCNELVVSPDPVKRIIDYLEEEYEKNHN